MSMNHVRGMLWLLFSISFCLAAASLTLALDQRQHSAIDHLALNSHSSVRSVYTRMGADGGSALSVIYGDAKASGDLDTYTGLQIIHSLKEWCIQGQLVIVDGRTLTTGSATDSVDVLEESRNIALNVLDLKAEYTAKRTYYADGNIQNTLFYQR